MASIGVFLRCLGIADVREALPAVRQEVGVDLIQVSKLPDAYYSPEGAREFARLMAEAGVRADSVVIVHEGESYADLETVRRTVGYLPEETLEERVRYSLRCAEFAAALGIPTVTTHMGFLPEDADAPGYRRLVDAVGRVTAFAADRGVRLALETGQETGEQLLAFLRRVDNRALGVNFDAANMVMYGTGDPLPTLALLREHVMGVHVKDAVPSATPGLLGHEVSPGRGDAEIAGCIRYLARSGYTGSFIVENYVARHGSLADRMQELRSAVDFVRAAIPG